MSRREPMPLDEAWWQFKRELRHRRAARLAAKLAKTLDDTPADDRLIEAILQWMEAPKHEHRALYP
jgi:hypothetical protein